MEKLYSEETYLYAAASQKSCLRHHYRQAVDEFYLWHKLRREHAPQWEVLQPEDFQSYFGFLNHIHLSRAAIRLRLGALKSFYEFLIRHGFATASPMRDISLAKIANGHRASVSIRTWSDPGCLTAMRYGC